MAESVDLRKAHDAAARRRRRKPAEVLQETKDVGVDGEGGAVHAEEENAGGCFGANAWVAGKVGHNLL